MAIYEKHLPLLSYWTVLENNSMHYVVIMPTISWDN